MVYWKHCEGTQDTPKTDRKTDTDVLCHLPKGEEIYAPRAAGM